MATAFSPYRPPERGLVSFVLSNLLPTKKEESKDESARLSHMQGEVGQVDEGMRQVQEPERGGSRFEGSRHRTG